MAILLATLTLPDLVWVDEFEYEPVTQALQRTLGGAQVLEESGLIAGRPITLGADDQFLSRSALIQVYALASTPGQTHTLVLQGTSYTVVFRRPAVRARPAFPTTEPDGADDYSVQINLMTV